MFECGWVNAYVRCRSVYACQYIRVYAWVRIYVCVNVCMYVRMFECLCV